MFFVLEGKLTVTTTSGCAPGMRERVLATIGAGGFFGEIDMVLCQRRTARVRAAELCALYLVTREEFDDALEARFCPHIYATPSRSVALPPRRETCHCPSYHLGCLPRRRLRRRIRSAWSRL